MFKDIVAMHRRDLLFYFPNAPTRPITVMFGIKIPAWFDLYGYSPDSKEDDQVLLLLLLLCLLISVETAFYNNLDERR